MVEELFKPAQVEPAAAEKFIFHGSVGLVKKYHSHIRRVSRGEGEAGTAAEPLRSLDNFNDNTLKDLIDEGVERVVELLPAKGLRNRGAKTAPSAGSESETRRAPSGARRGSDARSRAKTASAAAEDSSPNSAARVASSDSSSESAILEARRSGRARTLATAASTKKAHSRASSVTVRKRVPTSLPHSRLESRQRSARGSTLIADEDEEDRMRRRRVLSRTGVAAPRGPIYKSRRELFATAHPQTDYLPAASFRWRRRRLKPSPFPVWSTVKTVLGKTHYKLEGDPRGEFIVLIHGFNASRCQLEPIIEKLLLLGHYCLSYDCFGFGLSTAPGYDFFSGYNYTLQFYVDQLRQLLVYLGLAKRVITFVTFGGGFLIAASYGATDRHRVSKIFTIAPCGLLSSSNAPCRLIRRLDFLIPAVSWLVNKRWFTRQSFLKRCSPEDVRSGFAQSVWEKFEYVLFEKSRGVEAYLSCVGRFPVWEAHDMWRKISATEIPVLILWGTLDTVTPCSDANIAYDLIRNLHIVFFPGCTHQLLRERPNETMALVATFVDFPSQCRMDDIQYLLPYSAQGEYRRPEERLPPHMARKEYFHFLGFRPKRSFQVTALAPAAPDFLAAP